MVSSKATTVAEYLKSLAPERRQDVSRVRQTIRKHLPKGYVETMQYGMIAYVVPLAKHPNTYNGQPLTVAALAAQKNYCSLYLMGCYADAKLSGWFEKAWRASGKKLDMGKACVRFKTADDLALDVVAEVIAKVPVAQLIAQHDAVHGSDARRRRREKHGLAAQDANRGAAKKPAAKKAARKAPAKKRGRSTKKATGRRI